jgi:hypothetical protein
VIANIIRDGPLGILHNIRDAYRRNRFANAYRIVGFVEMIEKRVWHQEKTRFQLSRRKLHICSSATRRRFVVGETAGIASEGVTVS